MINLLPLSARNRVKNVYRLRWIGVGSLLFAGVVFSGLVLLVPPYVLMISREEAVLEHKAQVESLLQETQGAVASNVVSELNYSLEQIESFEKQADVVPVLAAILAVERKGIVLNSLAVELVEGKSGVILSGVASTRDALTRFSQDLKRLPHLAKVTLPVSDLAEAANSTFTISAVIAGASVESDQEIEVESP